MLADPVTAGSAARTWEPVARPTGSVILQQDLLSMTDESGLSTLMSSGACLQVGQVGADCLLNAIERVGVGRILIHQPGVRYSGGIQQPNVPNEIRIPLG
jgi:hypothetical protein